LDQVTLNVLNAGTALRDALIPLNTNDALELSGLPMGRDFRGFVEGVEWRLDSFRADLSIVVTAEVLSAGAERYGQVDATIAWQDVDADLEWSDARKVTV
jgi:hypothetical protein